MILKNLIEAAADKIGSRYKVAQHLGVSPNRVNDWYHQRQVCQPADQARIADLAGEDAIETLIEATIEQHEGTPRGEQLRAALKKRIGQLGAESGSVAVGVMALLAGGSWLSILFNIPRCIESKLSIKVNTGFTSDGLAKLG
jgi:DNA-binding transcriptional regulator YdaS (Cro superfamily)